MVITCSIAGCCYCYMLTCKVVLSRDISCVTYVSSTLLSMVSLNARSVKVNILSVVY